MRYYPLFLDLKGKKVVFSGVGEHAAAKIRLLLKTEADIHVVGLGPCADVVSWACDRKITLHTENLSLKHVENARLVYGANDELEADTYAVEIGKAAGALTNIVDNLEISEFLTPAIVDRDPVTIAIGTEGKAPVLARKIKSEIEEMLPASTGLLARIGDAFRPVAGTLPSARLRRDYWTKFFFSEGPKALAEGGRKAVSERLETLYHEVASEASMASPKQGSVALVGTGPGDPELLTLKARRKIHEAEVVLYDQLVTPEILELARREAILVHVGKKGFGQSWKQDDINALLIEHAKAGAQIVRLKSGDPSIFGRMDEELDALDKAQIEWEVVPGITAASAAASSIGTSLTRRGRNSSLQFLTGHDVNGFAEQDWANLSAPGATAAIYMGLKASTFIRGRLLMHGARPSTPVTIISNASRINQKVITTTLVELPDAIKAADMSAPAILLLGLKSRRVAQAFETIQNQKTYTGAA
ncbi:MAG: siroheme synthase CysG [Salaquimonas sp.]